MRQLRHHRQAACATCWHTSSPPATPPQCNSGTRQPRLYPRLSPVGSIRHIQSRLLPSTLWQGPAISLSLLCMPAVESALLKVTGVLDVGVNLLTGVAEVRGVRMGRRSTLGCWVRGHTAAIGGQTLAHSEYTAAYKIHDNCGVTRPSSVDQPRGGSRCAMTRTPPARGTCWRLWRAWASLRRPSQSSAWVRGGVCRLCGGSHRPAVLQVDGSAPAVPWLPCAQRQQRGALAPPAAAASKTCSDMPPQTWSFQLCACAAAADFMEAGRVESARWRRQFALAALLTIPVFLSSMVLPMAWPAAAVRLASIKVHVRGPAVDSAAHSLHCCTVCPCLQSRVCSASLGHASRALCCLCLSSHCC